MNRKLVHNLIWIFIAINIVLSFISYIAITTNDAFCIIKSDCSEVQKSKYGEIFGIKVSILGTISFLLLLLIYAFALRQKQIYPFFILANLGGSIFALWFIYLQFFVLSRICSSCMIIDGLTLIITALSIYEFIKYKSEFKSVFSYFK
jgi:uncharacterized membrane protein